MLARILLVSLLLTQTVIIPDPGDILIDQQGNVYQDTGSSIITPNGVIVRQEDQSQKFQDTYKDTMKDLDSLLKKQD